MLQREGIVVPTIVRGAVFECKISDTDGECLVRPLR